MDIDFHVQVLHDAADILKGLMQVGIHLSSLRDRRKMLDMILHEARTVARAEAGSLFVQRQQRLRFVAAQNDRLGDGALSKVFLDREIPATSNSLAGFVASTGQVVNIPDADTIDPDAPFCLNRDFDHASGYHTKSVLAIPLHRPDGSCVGVLQLLNRLDEEGQVVPFPNAEGSGILSLASMAAVTIHNALLQEDLKAAHLDTIIRLSVVVEHRDNATAQHIRRISRTARLIAEAMGLDHRQAELIECAAPMHDIGKVGIPDCILHKPSPLTPEERQSVQQHTLIGADILGHPQNELIAMAHDIAISHHERWDGRGYPHGLSGREIPLAGRIVCLADVFDALLSRRCYKNAYSIETVRDILRSERGKQFDPAVVDAYFRAEAAILDAYEAEEHTPEPTTVTAAHFPAPAKAGG
jgi:HD-GYP domain-containing protein (c-di-GMP phosphodiesterase class II)